MFSLEDRHWWFIGRRKIICALIRRFASSAALSNRSLKVCDLGCGCGANLVALTGFCDVVGLDPSAEAIKYCRMRGLSNVVTGSLPDNVPFRRNAFDVVLLLDVLEHIDDDAEAVHVACDLLHRGGIFIATVPACPWLWSKRDESHQHRRRYNIDGFGRLLQAPGLHLEILSYYNALLFPIAAASRLTRRMLQRDAQGPDLSVPRAPFNSILARILASEQNLIPKEILPLGLSLICVSRKEAPAPSSVV
jgi:SAM-dependent methyltransferase